MSLVEDLMAKGEMFEYAGKMYDLETFAAAYGVPIESAEQVILVLEKQGKVQRGTEEEIADRAVRKALKEAGVFSAANEIEQDQLNEKIYNKMVKRGSRHVYPQVEFSFGNMTALKEFMQSVKEMLLQSEVVMDEDGRVFTLRVFDLSDKELTTLSNLYKVNKAVKTTVDLTSKGFDNALKATDYTAKKVVVPVAKIGITGMLSIGKSLAAVTAKVGGLAVSETIRAVRDTSKAITEDENITVARAEVCRTKNEMLQGFNKKNYGGGGIKIG